MMNSLNWFEIASSDFARAVTFYSAVWNTSLKVEEMGDLRMAVFPSEGEGSCAGAVVGSAFHKPSAEGTLVYLNANSGMDAMLERISNAGGSIVMPRTLITPEIGYMAVFRDSEGNHVALHSNH